MRYRTGGRLAAIAAAISGLALVLAAPALGAPFIVPPQGTPIAGDLGAWHDVVAAFQKLAAISYRAKGTDGTLMEYSPPGSTRTVTPRMETITVGGVTHYRNTGGIPSTWQCAAPTTTAAEGAQLMAALHPSIEVSKNPDTMIDGTPVHAYSVVYTLQANGQRSSLPITVYVGTRSGLPRRAQSPPWFGATTDVVTDYYDYGAPVSITLPACGAP